MAKISGFLAFASQSFVFYFRRIDIFRPVSLAARVFLNLMGFFALSVPPVLSCVKNFQSFAFGQFQIYWPFTGLRELWYCAVLYIIWYANQTVFIVAGLRHFGDDIKNCNISRPSHPLNSVMSSGIFDALAATVFSGRFRSTFPKLQKIQNGWFHLVNAVFHPQLRLWTHQRFNHDQSVFLRGHQEPHLGPSLYDRLLSQSHARCPPFGVSLPLLPFPRFQRFLFFYHSRCGLLPMLYRKLRRFFFGLSGKLIEDRHLTVTNENILLGVWKFYYVVVQKSGSHQHLDGESVGHD